MAVSPYSVQNLSACCTAGLNSTVEPESGVTMLNITKDGKNNFFPESTTWE